MPKVVITFEDTLQGGAKATANPSYEMLMAKEKSGEVLTLGEKYAMLAMALVRRASKNFREGKAGKAIEDIVLPKRVGKA